MNKKKTILLCGPSRTAVSGVSTHLNQLFNSSIGVRYSLWHFQVGNEGRNENYIQKFLRYFSSPFILMLTINRTNASIIHLNTSLDRKAYWRDLVYLILSKLMGCKVVFQIHGGKSPIVFLGNNILGHSFLRWSLSIPDAIVVLAEIEHKVYTNFVTHKQVKIIPNAIELKEYNNMHIRNYKNKEITIGYIGRLAREKGIQDVIKAISILEQQGIRSLKFIIAGSGSYEEHLRQLVSIKGLNENISFLGPVFNNKKNEFWQEIDIFVFPTYREGLPYSILESIASGVPVITTQVGGIPDVIEDGVQGVFVDISDPDSVARAIENLIKNRNKLRKMSSAAIQRAHKYFGIERLASQFDQLYQEIVR